MEKDTSVVNETSSLSERFEAFNQNQEPIFAEAWTGGWYPTEKYKNDLARLISEVNFTNRFANNSQIVMLTDQDPRGYIMVFGKIQDYTEYPIAFYTEKNFPISIKKLDVFLSLRKPCWTESVLQKTRTTASDDPIPKITVFYSEKIVQRSNLKIYSIEQINAFLIKRREQQIAQLFVKYQGE